MDNEERKRLAAERSSEVNKGNTHSSKINRLVRTNLFDLFKLSCLVLSSIAILLLNTLWNANF